MKLGRPSEFTDRTKWLAFEKAEGKCELCGMKIVGVAEYDHRIPLAHDGASDDSNIQCLCQRCHRNKTAKQDVPAISKTKRILNRRAGLRKSKWPLRSRGFQNPRYQEGNSDGDS